MSKPEIGTKRQCTNCGAKYFDLRKSPIVCPKCGVVFQAARIQTREVFRRAAKAVPEMEAEESDIQMVPLEEVEEGDDKLAAAATDELEAESEPADDAGLPEEEEELTGDISPLIDGDLTPGEED